MYFPEDGAASAAAEPVTPIQGADGAAARPEPDTRSLEPAARPRETTRTALDRAFATVEQQEADEVEAAAGNKPPTPGAPGRDERGRFKAGDDAKAALLDVDPDALGKDGKPTDGKQPATMEPPTRFSPDAKAAWKDVPDPVKGEVSRAVRELETGIREYQQVFEPLKPFYQMAQEHGVQIHDALKNYVAIDQALVSKDPQERLSTIEHLLGLAGISPREYAAYISGQPAPAADEVQAQNNHTIQTLRQEIADLRNQLGGVTQSVQQRHQDEALRHVEAFAEANPRLKEPEFQKSVFRLLETKMAADLQSAFDMASRLNPAPVVDAQTTAASSAADKPNSDQTRKGKFSIAGAPTSGSNPANRKPPASARESIDRVFAEMGLGG